MNDLLRPAPNAVIGCGIGLLDYILKRRMNIVSSLHEMNGNLLRVPAVAQWLSPVLTTQGP